MTTIVNTSTQNLFRIKTRFPATQYFIKIDNTANVNAELCRAIVELEQKCVVTSVSAVEPDGSFPRIAFRHSKEYLQAKKQPGFNSVIDGILDSGEEDATKKLESLGDMIAREAFMDEESPERVGRDVLRAYRENDAEAMLIAITGWSLKSLLDSIPENHENGGSSDD